MNVSEYFQFYGLCVENMVTKFAKNKLFPIETKKVGEYYDVVAGLEFSDEIVKSFDISFKEKKELLKNRISETEGNDNEKFTCQIYAKEFTNKLGLTRDWCKERRSIESLECLGKMSCLAPDHNEKCCPKVFSSYRALVKHLQLDHNVPSTRVEYVALEMKKLLIERSKNENETNKKKETAFEEFQKKYQQMVSEKEEISMEDAGVKYDHPEFSKMNFKIPFNGILYILIDFETTGTDINNDEVTQIAAYIITNNLSVLKGFTSFIKTKSCFSDFIKDKKGKVYFHQVVYSMLKKCSST